MPLLTQQVSRGYVIGLGVHMHVCVCTYDKKKNFFFTINEFRVAQKVQKQERLRGDFWFWKLFWESWSYSVQGMNIRFQCLILHP